MAAILGRTGVGQGELLRLQLPCVAHVCVCDRLLPAPKRSRATWASLERFGLLCVQRQPHLAQPWHFQAWKDPGEGTTAAELAGTKGGRVCRGRTTEEAVDLLLQEAKAGGGSHGSSRYEGQGGGWGL